MMWDGYGPFGLFWLLIWAIVVAIPVARILGRLGYSKWWTILALIPLVNLVFLWVLAFADWPRDRTAGG